MKLIDISTPKHPNIFAIVDEEDYERVVDGYKWHAVKFGNSMYAKRMCKNNRNKSQLLHRLILNAQEGQEIDHRDYNGLNCQKSNLRFCTHAENMQNCRTRKNKTSKYKGVCWAKRERKWVSGISCNKKYNHIGYYRTESEAAIAYDFKAKELFGEYAVLNFKIKVKR